MEGLGIVARFTLKPGKEAEFDRLTAEAAEGIRAHEPGTLFYATHRMVEAPSSRVFYELYRDRSAFEAHLKQPHVQRLLDASSELVDSQTVDFLDLTDGKLPPVR